MRQAEANDEGVVTSRCSRVASVDACFWLARTRVCTASRTPTDDPLNASNATSARTQKVNNSHNPITLILIFSQIRSLAKELYSYMYMYIVLPVHLSSVKINYKNNSFPFGSINF